MFTLIRKDLLLHKTAFIAYTPVLVIFLTWMASDGESPNAFITFTCIYAAILPLVLIAREDKFGAEAFICSLPVTRRQVTGAKYLVSWAIAVVYSLIGLALYSMVAGEARFAIWNMATVGRALLTLTLCLGLMLPFLMRFGWLGMILGLVGIQMLGIVALLSAKAFSTDLGIKDVFSSISNLMEGMHSFLGGPLFAVAALVILVAVNLVSYRIAAALFGRREL